MNEQARMVWARWSRWTRGNNLDPFWTAMGLSSVVVGLLLLLTGW